MKKLLASLTVALALLPAQTASADILNLSAGVFPDDEFAALSSTGDPFAVGGGTTATGTHFAFSAHCKNTNGQCFFAGQPAPSGYAVVSDPVLGQAQGHVCGAIVVGSTAAFDIVVEKGSGFLGSSPLVSFRVIDGGQPPSGADTISVAAPPQDCRSLIIHADQVVTQGNIVVK
jgi:hypothetical protein